MLVVVENGGIGNQNQSHMGRWGIKAKGGNSKRVVVRQAVPKVQAGVAHVMGTPGEGRNSKVAGRAEGSGRE